MRLSKTTQKYLAVAAAVAVSVSASFAVSAQQITGAGATFPFPIYAKWAEEYKKATNVSMKLIFEV